MSNSRLVFAVLCAAGVLAICAGAALEIGRWRRGEILSSRQFRARMVSAAIWITILMTNLYAVTALWPEVKYLSPGVVSPQSKHQARVFLSVILGSFALIFVGLGLLLFDLRQISRERRLQRAQFQAEVAALARESRAQK